MRMLHVGWGYSPLFSGGVTIYVEDLLCALVARGHEVHYLCCGRADLKLTPHLKTWSRNGVWIHELRNPPARITPFVGTRRPEVDVEHAGVRCLFRQVLDTVRPEVVHLHEFLGWPARIVDDVKAAGIRLVITLEDLHCLCPTQLLYKREDGENCNNYQDGHGCVRCCRRSPSETLTNMKSAVWYAAQPLRTSAPGVYTILRKAEEAVVRAFHRFSPFHQNRAMTSADEQELARGFRVRRAEFTRLLRRADVVHCISSALSHLHRQHGVDSPMLHLGTTVAAISQIRRTQRRPTRPLVFGFRGGCTKGKGAHVLLEAFRGISPKDAVLCIHGPMDPLLSAEVKELEAQGRARYGGPYSREQLQQVLDGTDVGVIPSVWQETYCLVGLEFLAAGIPVIASRIGGITDYLIDGRDGLLLPPGDAQALRAALQRFIADPELVLRLRESIGPVKTLEQHVAEVEAFYTAQDRQPVLAQL